MGPYVGGRRGQVQGLGTLLAANWKEGDVAKCMVKASYTAEGVRGLAKEGGSGRRTAVTKAIEGMGGKIDGFYFAYGDVDAYVICDLPVFFFQAEDGIRDHCVTGVQTCALPI